MSLSDVPSCALCQTRLYTTSGRVWEVATDRFFCVDTLACAFRVRQLADAKLQDRVTSGRELLTI